MVPVRGFEGTGALVRLGLRRDRILLPAWISLLVLTVVGSAGAVEGLYPTEASRIEAANAVNDSAALAYAGLVDLGRAVTQRPTIAWLSLLVGGLTFGVGMTMAGGCANRNLVRLGNGSVRSLVVLTFMAIASYMTLKGLFGQWRASFLDPVAIDLAGAGWPDQSLATAVARATGLPAGTALAVTAGVFGLALLVFTFMDKRFRANLVQVVGGVVIGLVVVGGWYVSGHLGFGEHPQTMENVYFATNSRAMESMSFVGPMAFGLELLMLWTDASLHVTFGIASVLGVIAGSALFALSALAGGFESDLVVHAPSISTGLSASLVP